MHDSEFSMLGHLVTVVERVFSTFSVLKEVTLLEVCIEDCIRGVIL